MNEGRSQTAGDGFAAKDATKSMRVIDNASLLQAEAVAITGSLTHASLREGHVVVHTDSSAAADSLQHSMRYDIYLSLV